MVPGALPLGVGALLAAFVGSILGSFIATLVLRWPAGRSVGGRSRCDKCGCVLGARDLVPLASAFALRGRCRHCGTQIDPFHGRVELAAALIGAAAVAIMPGPGGWLWALFGWLLFPLALLDARHMWLPDRLNAALAIVGLVMGGGLLGTSLFDRWVGALAGGLTLAAVAWVYRRIRESEGMGGGDPKLVAAIGCWLGWQPLPLLLLLASVGGILWALVAKREGDRLLASRPVPFGVFACGAAFAAVPLWPLVSAR